MIERRRLGASDLSVSSIVLGAMNFGGPTPPEDAARIVDAALAGGVNLIDVADVYEDGRSEELVGSLVRQRRDEVLIASKVGMPSAAVRAPDTHRRAHIVASCEASLRRLGTDRIDLYQLHKPCFEVPLEEQLAALGELVDAGKVRWVGCSSHPAWLVVEALWQAERAGLPRFVSEQPPYNLLDRRIEAELVPMARRHGVGLLAWSPLAAGMLAGRYPGGALPAESRAARKPQVRQRVSGAALAAAAAFGGVAAEAGIDPAALAVAWVCSRPGVTAAIVGPRTLGHLEAALGATTVVLDVDVLAALDGIVPPGGAVADFHNTNGWSPPLASE